MVRNLKNIAICFTDLTGSMFNLDIPGMEQSKQGNRSVQGSSSYASASQLQNNFSGTSQQQVTSSDSLSTLDNASLGASQRLGSSSDTHSTHRTAFYRFDHLSSFKVLHSACWNEVWIISEVWHETGTWCKKRRKQCKEQNKLSRKSNRLRIDHTSRKYPNLQFWLNLWINVLLLITSKNKVVLSLIGRF